MTYNGKTKDGRQKYKCITCGNVVTEKVAYKANSKSYKLLNLLYNIIKQPITTPQKLQELFTGNFSEKSELNNIYFSFFGGKGSDIDIICKNPRLVISLGKDNDLIVYRLPNVERDKKGNRTFRLLDKKDFSISLEDKNRYHIFKHKKRKKRKE